MILKLKKRHIKGTIYKNGQKCAIAKALREEIGRLRPKWENSFIQVGIDNVCFTPPGEHIRPPHKLAKPYLAFDFLIDRWKSFFVTQNVTLRTIHIPGLHLPELSEMTSESLLSPPQVEQEA